MGNIGTHECAQVDKKRVNPFLQSTHRARRQLSAQGTMLLIRNVQVLH